MKVKTHILSVIALSLLLSVFSGCRKNSESGIVYGEITDTVVSVDAISDFGDVRLNVRTEDLMKAGFSYADILQVNLNGKSYDLPLVSSPKQIETGCGAVLAQNNGSVSFAMLLNYFAEKHNIATVLIGGDKKMTWTPTSDRVFPLSVTISMKQKGGYAEMYRIFSQPFITVFAETGKTAEEFCNFREVKTRGIAGGVLYRGASPVDNTYGRRDVADGLLSKYGIRTVVNMANTPSEAGAFDKFRDSHYSGLNVGYFKITTLDIGKIRSELAGAFRHIINSEPPYYIHCLEGIDRTGALVAVLEGITGSNGGDLLEEDMITYLNYYDVRKGTASYKKLSEHVFRMISMLHGKDVTPNDDFPVICEEILKDVGLTQAEISALRSRLNPSDR